MTVLLSIAPPDGTTKYVDQLSEGKVDDVEYKYFSWKTALLSSYDIFHVHWPEYLIRTRKGRGWLRPLKIQLFKLLLLKLRFSGVVVVRTLHNLRPHEEGDSKESMLLKELDVLTTLSVRLNKATPIVEGRDVTILHGHFIGRYPDAEVTHSQRGRLLYFGLIRPYKGVERLLEVFSSVNDGALSLRVVGSPTPELRDIVENACTDNERITSRLEYVPDRDLASEIYKAELVVLPYKEMHNSGAILLALSLGRPVLVPHSTANELLSEEVGVGWVNMYDGELTREILLGALTVVREEGRTTLPRLSERDWSEVGKRHYDAYIKAMKKRLS